jgi:hypothetical protein
MHDGRDKKEGSQGTYQDRQRSGEERVKLSNWDMRKKGR